MHLAGAGSAGHSGRVPVPPSSPPSTPPAGAAEPPDDGPTDDGSAEAAGDSAVRPRRRFGWGTLGVLVVVVGLIVMWGYAFFATPPAPGRIEGSSFPTDAERICAAAKADLERVPRSITVKTSAERAALVDQGTDILDRMLDQLAAAAPTQEPGATITREWIQDWRTYDTNRRDYAQRLRTDPNARFYVSQSTRDSAQITAAVDRLARVNGMEACTVPDDVG